MSTTVNLDHTLSFKRTKKLTKAAIKNRKPIMLWGKPGIGKSDMIREIGKELGREVIDIRTCTFSEVDIKGYPYLDQKTGTMKFAIANELPRDEKSTAIIFFDELPAALPTTQTALFQLILDRKIGEYSLPEGVSLVAAGNRDGDGAGTFAMLKPLENRLMHVEVEPTFEEWRDYAIEHEVYRDVISYLLKNPHRLNAFDPETSNRAFPTQRTWTVFSDIMKNSDGEYDDSEDVFDICAANIGTGIAREFVAFKRMADKLPDPMDVLKGKVKKIADVESSIVYAITTNLLFKLRELSKVKVDDEWHGYADTFFKFLMDNEKVIGPEFVAMACASGYAVYKIPFAYKKTPHMMEAMDRYKILFQGI